MDWYQTNPTHDLAEIEEMQRRQKCDSSLRNKCKLSDRQCFGLHEACWVEKRANNMALLIACILVGPLLHGLARWWCGIGNWSEE
jgi:hypothetical protein